MSSGAGYPDYQRITQWLGAPFAQATALALGAGSHADGPYEVANFASVIVALKPTGGPVAVTIKQTVPGGPAGLILSETVVVAAGATLFEAFVLYGAAVELDLVGSVVGTTVDYAIYPSNTTTNSQVISTSVVDVQHNDVRVGGEPALDFEDAGAFVWTVTDDPANARMKITPPRIISGKVNGGASVIDRGTGFTIGRTGVGRYTVTFTTAFATVPLVVVCASDNNAAGNATVNSETVNGFNVCVGNIQAAGAALDDEYEFIAIGT